MIGIAGFGPESMRNSVRAATNAAENRRQERRPRRIGRLAGCVSDWWAITMEGGEMAGATGPIGPGAVPGGSQLSRARLIRPSPDKQLTLAVKP